VHVINDDVLDISLRRRGDVKCTRLFVLEIKGYARCVALG
jgi:hypothetical protein